MYITILLCLLPLLCIGQSSTTSLAATHHQQALKHIQQQIPQAKIIDLEALKAQQAQEHESCKSCGFKANLQAPNTTTYAPRKASKEALIAKEARLKNTIKTLYAAKPVDVQLLQKYRRALELNNNALKEIQDDEMRQAKQHTLK